MHKRLRFPVILIYFLQYLIGGCDSTDSSTYHSIPIDSVSVATGKMSFSRYCSGCHNMRRDGIGPKLEGITGRVSLTWLRGFIKDPQQLISSKDKHALELFQQYKVVMPSFPAIRTGELDTLISFLQVHQTVIGPRDTSKVAGLANPIAEKIEVSGLVINIEPYIQFPSSSHSGNPPLSRITKLGFEPNDDALFVNDLRGKLYKIVNDRPVVFMDMAKLRPNFINVPGLATGLGSFAFHPDFKKNHLFYTTHTEVPGTQKADFDFADTIGATVQWVLTEWKTDLPEADSFSGTSRELFRVNMVSGIHGVQEITFNPLSKPGDEDYGLLYIGVGDGGSVENDYPFLVHDKAKVWGTIMRINPAGNNSGNGKYGIPETNPFAKVADGKALGEIYAYGFRNPHRISWTKKGLLLVCNIGQASIESINLIRPGQDYGWPLREGTFVSSDVNENLGKVHSLPANDSIYHFTYPVAQYDHDEGLAISGGYEYWGTAVPRLNGKYLFGDIPSGRLFYVQVADLLQGKQATIREWKVAINGKITTLKNACGNDRVDLHFGRDARGELYILTKADGRLYKIRGVMGEPY